MLTFLPPLCLPLFKVTNTFLPELIKRIVFACFVFTMATMYKGKRGYEIIEIFNRYSDVTVAYILNTTLDFKHAVVFVRRNIEPRSQNVFSL